MSSYKLIFHIDTENQNKLSSYAFDDFKCMGAEEYSMDEQEVDNILGEKSFSGGNLPMSVLSDLDAFKTNGIKPIAYFFEDKHLAITFRDFCLKNFGKESQLVEIVDQDWNENWRSHYSSIKIDEKFSIIPSWEKSENQSKQLRIYPGMGFGTGNHETTYLCLKILMEILETNKKISNCLDFGCGSGILGLALRVFNERAQIDLYDIDNDALKNCMQNIELNKFSIDKINVWPEESKKLLANKYNLVFANILQETLILEKEIICNSVKTGGDLIISGLLEGQDNKIIKEYKLFNKKLEHVKTIRKNEWLCIHMRHL